MPAKRAARPVSPRVTAEPGIKAAVERFNALIQPDHRDGMRAVLAQIADRHALKSDVAKVRAILADTKARGLHIGSAAYLNALADLIAGLLRQHSVDDKLAAFGARGKRMRAHGRDGAPPKPRTVGATGARVVRRARAG